MVPGNVKSSNERIGDRGGGLTTAEHWVTTFHCLLPFITMYLWSATLAQPRGDQLLFYPEKRSVDWELKLDMKLVKDVLPITMLL